MTKDVKIPGSAGLAQHLGLYVLDGKTPVPVDDMESWSYFMWGEDHSRTIVGRTEPKPGVLISTIFTGIAMPNHGWPSLLFETMVFENKDVLYSRRYATWEEAEKGHTEAIAFWEKHH